MAGGIISCPSGQDAGRLPEDPEPVSISLDGVTAGWLDVFRRMSVGSRGQVVVPPAPRCSLVAAELLGPDATLVFDVTLVAIE